MQIRIATADDAERVAELLTELDYPTRADEARKRLDKFSGRDDCRVLVGTDDRDRPIALASAHVYPTLERNASSGTITAMVVSREARRTGVGRALVAAIETFLRERGCVRVTVNSAIRRQDAHAFYESLGYERTGFRFARMLVMMTAMLLAACVTTTTKPPHVDHVILGISDLDAGIRELESRTGVRAVYGGEHPGRGTRNALASLGCQTYLEIIAPQAGAKIEGDFAGLVKLDHLTPAGFAVFADDVEAFRKQLTRDGVQTTEPMAGSRVTPSGTTLHWSTFGITEPRLDVAPFFIHWNDLSVHPSKTSPGGCVLVSLEMSSPDAAALATLQRALGKAIATRTGAAGLAFTFRCGTREVRLPQ